MMNENGRAAHFLHSTWGAIVALGTAAAIGAAVAMKISGLTGLPADVDALQEQMEYATALQEWVVCNSVPPNRADILQALRVRCPPVGPRRAAEEIGPPPEVSE